MNDLVDKLIVRLAQKAGEQRKRFPPDEMPARFQAGQWINFPLYISQPLVPIFISLGPDLIVIAIVAIGFTVADYVWIRSVGMRGVSLLAMNVADKTVPLKWVASPVCAIFLWLSGAHSAALFALLWPLLVLPILTALHRFWSMRDLQITQRGFRLAAKEASLKWRSHRRCA